MTVPSARCAWLLQSANNMNYTVPLAISLHSRWRQCRMTGMCQCRFVTLLFEFLLPISNTFHEGSYSDKGGVLIIWSFSLFRFSLVIKVGDWIMIIFKDRFSWLLINSISYCPYEHHVNNELYLCNYLLLFLSLSRPRLYSSVSAAAFVLFISDAIYTVNPE